MEYLIACDEPSCCCNGEFCSPVVVVEGKGVGVGEGRDVPGRNVLDPFLWAQFCWAFLWVWGCRDGSVRRTNFWKFLVHYREGL